MSTRAQLAAAIWLALAGAAGPAAPQATALPESATPLRFDPSLVQMDVVVTDAAGRRVTGLAAGDFRIWQDGKPQKISQCSYIPLTASSGTAWNAGVRRTTLLFVDNGHLSYPDFVRVRQAISRYVESDIHAGDYVAVMGSFGESGFLQQFTNDPAQLRLAVSEMRWSPVLPTNYLMYSLVRAIRGLRELPGRKSVVVFSGGLSPIGSAADRDREIIPNLSKEVTDAANRASATIYAIDARGTAARSAASEDLTAQLAEQAGGLALRGSNDVLAQIRTAVSDQDGYYLVGWDPGPAAFRQKKGRPPQYHEIRVIVARAGLQARSRAGYFGAPETPEAAPYLAPQAQESLFAPFRSGDIAVRMESRFSADERRGEYVESLVRIGPQGVAFREDGGCRTAALQLTIAAAPVEPGLGDIGKVEEKIITQRACGDDVARMMREGIVCLIHSKPQPGSYQMRVAVRNRGPEEPRPPGPQESLIRRPPGEPGPPRLGMACQFITVPNLETGELALSGIALRSENWQSPDQSNDDEPVTRLPSDGGPAVRRFHNGDSLVYTLRLFHAPPRDDANSPVHLQMVILGASATLYSGPEKALNLVGVDTVTGLQVGGSYKLQGVAPGHYVLGLIATEKPPKGSPRTVQQWTDFEVLP
ncbi:MAG TPA: VWA domain-containing protein [Bryobacteraceae bacterium]|nr:VWA domain-containing protein [Bryobacteraceae bacterium]